MQVSLTQKELETLQSEAAQELKKKIKERFNAISSRYLDILFMTPHEKQRLMQNNTQITVLAYRCNTDVKTIEKDIGLLYNRYIEFITEEANSEANEKMAREYISQHFQAKLKQACDQAMDHKAKTLAYRIIQEKK